MKAMPTSMIWDSGSYRGDVREEAIDFIDSGGSFGSWTGHCEWNIKMMNYCASVTICLHVVVATFIS